MLRRVGLRCLQYVQRDVKEIVLPSSIPDGSATDPQPARLHARDIVRAFVEGSREYAQSWKYTRQSASEPATAPQNTGDESGEDMRMIAQASVEGLRPYLQNLYQTRLAVLQSISAAFVSGYHDGLADRKED